METQNETQPAVIATLDCTQTIFAYRKWVNAVNHFAELFESITESSFGSEAYKDVIESKPTRITDIFNSKLNQILKDIPAFAGIQSNYRNQAMVELQRLEKGFEELIKTYQGLLTTAGGGPETKLYRQEIRIVKGKAVWHDEDTKRIRERYFTIYADTPEMVTILELTEKFISCFNDLRDKLKELNQSEEYKGPLANPMYNWTAPDQGSLFGGFLGINDAGVIKADWEAIFSPPDGPEEKE